MPWETFWQDLTHTWKTSDDDTNVKYYSCHTVENFHSQVNQAAFFKSTVYPLPMSIESSNKHCIF